MNANGIILTLTALSVVGCGFAQIPNDLDLDGIQKTIQDNPELSDVQKQLEESGIQIPDLNGTKIEVKKIETVLREKCESRNAGNAVDNLKDQQETVKNCITLYLNGSEIETELEEAKKTGSMDEVFAKYCKKWPDVYACLDEPTTIVRTCLTEQEVASFNKTLDIVQEMQAFMCHKDGDRLALFVAEGGPECLKEKQEELTTCINSTLGVQFPNSGDFSAASLPLFIFTDQTCTNLDNLRICFKDQLERCSDTTPANIVDSTIKFIKKHLNCSTSETTFEVRARAAPSTSGGNSLLTASFVLVFATLFTTALRTHR